MKRKPPLKKFAWTKEVQASELLSRSAKHTGLVIAEEYIYADDRKCFASNNTLASLLNVSTRTIQRHVQELEEAHFVRFEKQRRHKRIIVLIYDRSTRGVTEGDTKGDISRDARVTSLTIKGDANVMTHKKKSLNKNTAANERSFPMVELRLTDTRNLADWGRWIELNTQFDRQALLAILWNETSYCFPSRYPPSDEYAEKRARDFFAWYASTKGSSAC